LATQFLRRPCVPTMTCLQETSCRQRRGTRREQGGSKA
jgi:hypothetical protein